MKMASRLITQLNLRTSALEELITAKNVLNLSFADIAKKINKSEVWTASAFLGQQSIPTCVAHKLLNLLQIKAEKANYIHDLIIQVPIRGKPNFSYDPTVYRLNELVQVYGPSIKAIINEKFGDGIMSSVDCNIQINKKIKSSGENRVQIIIEGKYLEYKD